jgi:hypothetical protein
VVLKIIRKLKVLYCERNSDAYTWPRLNVVILMNRYIYMHVLANQWFLKLSGSLNENL